MNIRQATPADSSALGLLAAQLWEHDAAVLAAEYAALTASPEAACFLAESDGSPVGFAQCQLRHDYVEGTETSPVGYLEGIYVQPDHQHRGIARALLSACEDWARTQGCKEFASDCELDNAASLAFHLALGFEEANRIICFTKKL